MVKYGVHAVTTLRNRVVIFIFTIIFGNNNCRILFVYTSFSQFCFLGLNKYYSSEIGPSDIDHGIVWILQ